jgi:hypothetical protein
MSSPAESGDSSWPQTLDSKLNGKPRAGQGAIGAIRGYRSTKSQD